MKKIITVYIILLTSSLLSVALPVRAQQPSQPKEVKTEEEKIPLYNGISIGVDLFGIGNKLFGGDYLSSEVSIDVNLKNRFFPVIEMGYGSTDTTDDDYGIHYKSSSPYARIGLDYNTMGKKKSDSYLFVGMRYGFTAFKYDVQAPELEDPIWNGSVPFSHNGINSRAHWMELLVGIKVKVIKNFQMGWTVRYKARFSVKDNVNATPWYIPGYGSNKSTNFGFTYNLIYKLPF